MKCLFGNFDSRCFKLCQKYFFSLIIKHQKIASFLQRVELKASFNLHKRFWIILVHVQKINPMLAHPLFRREHEILFAQFVENEKLIEFLRNL